MLKNFKILGAKNLSVLFTRELGKVTVSSFSRPGSKSKSNLSTKPFVLSKFRLEKSQDKYFIKSSHVITSYFSLGENLDRYYAACKILEFLDQALVSESFSPELYDLSIRAFSVLSNANSNFEPIVLAFLVKSIKILGFYPLLDTCVLCNSKLDKATREQNPTHFDIARGGIICNNCFFDTKNEEIRKHRLILSPSFDIFEVVNFMANSDLSVFAKLRPTADIYAELREILNSYIAYHLEFQLKQDS